MTNAPSLSLTTTGVFGTSPLVRTPAPDDIAPAYEYCRAVTRTHAKSFYFCAQTLPTRKRLPIYAIYALCRHIDDLVDTTRNADRAELTAKVEEWAVALRRVYDGGEFPSHPILVAWSDSLKSFPIKYENAVDLMRGCLMDLDQKDVRFQTFDELYVYAYRVASLVGLMSSEIFGYTDESALQYAEALGIAFQLTNILRDVGEDARRNRIYLPTDELARLGVTEDDVMRGTVTPNFVDLMKFQIRRARDYYREADKGIPMLSPDSRFTVFLSSRIYGGILEDIERHDYDVFSRRAHVSTIRKVVNVPKLWAQAKMKFGL